MLDMAAGMTLIKSAMEIVTSLRKNISEAKFQKELMVVYDSLVALSGEILSLQVQKAELSDVKRKLEQRLAEYDDWEKTKSRYVLEEFHPGLFVYALKKEFQGDEPLHYLCPACMEKRQKGILSKTRAKGSVYQCPICKVFFDTFDGHDFCGSMASL